MKLITGLGNPQEQYQLTKHNIGYQVIERIAQHNQIIIGRKKCNSILGEGIIGTKKVILAKPLTYMNLSGKAVRSVVNWGKINLKDLIVICDDVNLGFGTIRIRSKGSDGGHKGLRSIIDFLNSQDFPRLRIGVGSSRKIKDMTSYVLRPFSKRHTKIINESVDTAAEAAEVWVRDGIVAAMNRFNQMKPRLTA